GAFKRPQEDRAPAATHACRAVSVKTAESQIMSAVPHDDDLLASGTLTFTVEGRILRELGERLVKQPEVALVELIKNAYDADAKTCQVIYEPPEHIIVADDGHGMTFDEFRDGWMRIG